MLLILASVLYSFAIQLSPYVVLHIHIATVFTWLNTAATIRHVLKFYAATIQGWHILHLSTSMWLLFYISLKLRLTMHVGVLSKSLSTAKVCVKYSKLSNAQIIWNELVGRYLLCEQETHTEAMVFT